jgi:hypothetical protein
MGFRRASWIGHFQVVSLGGMSKQRIKSLLNSPIVADPDITPFWGYVRVGGDSPVIGSRSEWCVPLPVKWGQS